MPSRQCVEDECLYFSMIRYFNDNSFSDNMKQLFIRFHNDLICICKKEMLRRAEYWNRSYDQIYLNSKEIHELNMKLSYFILNVSAIIVHTSGSQILESFKIDSEADAKVFFNDNLKDKTYRDCYGNDIVISEKSRRFMYKDDESTELDKHIEMSENFKKSRAKRQSLIGKTIQESKIIFQRSHSRKDYDRMYLAKINEVEYDNNYYFAVIVFMNKKTKQAKFVTAFSIQDDDNIFRRLVLYNEIEK